MELATAVDEIAERIRALDEPAPGTSPLDDFLPPRGGNDAPVDPPAAEVVDEVGGGQLDHVIPSDVEVIDQHHAAIGRSRDTVIVGWTERKKEKESAGEVR